jgi:capsid portal protein
VQSILKQIVQKHIQDAGDSNWSEASLADVKVKFNVIKDAIVETGKDVPNAELNNIETVSDALAFFSRKSVLPDDARDSVQRYLEDDVEELPSNLSFHKREKFRIES